MRTMEKIGFWFYIHVVDEENSVFLKLWDINSTTSNMFEPPIPKNTKKKKRRLLFDRNKFSPLGNNFPSLV